MSLTLPVSGLYVVDDRVNHQLDQDTAITVNAAMKLNSSIRRSIGEDDSTLFQKANSGK